MGMFTIRTKSGQILSSSEEGDDQLASTYAKNRREAVYVFDGDQELDRFRPNGRKDRKPTRQEAIAHRTGQRLELKMSERLGRSHKLGEEWRDLLTEEEWFALVEEWNSEEAVRYVHGL